MVTLYVKEIILTITEPRLCPNCEKNDKFEKNIIFEKRSDGPTILCKRCETLIVITSHNLKKVELLGIKDYQIMLKEPYLIRKITY